MPYLLLSGYYDNRLWHVSACVGLQQEEVPVLSAPRRGGFDPSGDPIPPQP